MPARSMLSNLRGKLMMNVINSLPNDKFLDWPKFKELAGDKINMTEKLKLKGGKHCGKRRKCWLLAFSPFPTMFSKGFFARILKSRDCVVNISQETAVNPLTKFHTRPNPKGFADNNSSLALMVMFSTNVFDEGYVGKQPVNWKENCVE